MGRNIFLVLGISVLLWGSGAGLHLSHFPEGHPLGILKYPMRMAYNGSFKYACKLLKLNQILFNTAPTYPTDFRELAGDVADMCDYLFFDGAPPVGRKDFIVVPEMIDGMPSEETGLAVGVIM